MSADNVLLESFEVVDATSDSCFAEDLGGLREGGCRDEAVGLEGCSGDTLEYELGRCRLSVPDSDKLETLTLE